MASSAWSAYARAAQQLNEVRAADRERSGGRRETTAATRERIGALNDQLTEQQAELTKVAGLLRLPVPSFAARAPGSAPLGEGLSVPDRLDRADRGLAAADAATKSADAAGGAPLVLPTSSTHTRNAAIYAVFAVLGLGAQLVMIGLYSHHLAGAYTASAWACCGFPVVAFFAGYLAIGVLAKPRKSTEQVPRTPRLGALICAASLPVYVIAFALVSQVI